MCLAPMRSAPCSMLPSRVAAMHPGLSPCMHGDAREALRQASHLLGLKCRSHGGLQARHHLRLALLLGLAGRRHGSAGTGVQYEKVG